MVVVSFPVRNKLAYPAGTWARFDPSHPAAAGCQYAAIASGSDVFLNRIGAATSTVSSTPTAVLESIGPTVYSASGTQYNSFTIPVKSTATTSVTYAGIFRAIALNASYGTMISAEMGHTGIYANNGVLDYYNGSDNFGPTFVNGAAYFFAVSVGVIGSGVSPTVNVVVRNLATGSIQSQIIAGVAQTSTTIGGTSSIGSDSSSEVSGCRFAAASLSYTYLSVPQLLQWADDPWAFWYPPLARSRVAAAAATFLAGWAQQTNLPVLGTGTY